MSRLRTKIILKEKKFASLHLTIKNFIYSSDKLEEGKEYAKSI